MRYTLSIFRPGSKSDVAFQVDSDQPLPAIGRGDIIDPRAWPKHYNVFQEGVVLKVTEVKHAFGSDCNLSLSGHTLRVYTEATSDGAGPSVRPSAVDVSPQS